MSRLLRVAVDVVAILFFATLSRVFHAQSLDPAEIMRTASPFVAAALFGWVGIILSKRATARLVEGVVVWAVTLAFGTLFRILVGDLVDLAFVVETALVLGLLLVGWRAALTLSKRRFKRRAHTGPTGKDPARSGNPATRDAAGRKSRS